MTAPDLHPTGYGTQLVTLPQLIARHCSGAEPETVARLIEYLIGRPDIGIGSGQRPCPSDTSPASQACKSFHQTQTFADGTRYFCAFDFVRRNPLSTPSNPRPHIAPRTGDLPPQGSPAASLPPQGYGLHANVGTPGTPGYEPWHGQPSEIDGFDTWHQKGRPRPTPVLTGPFPPKPPPDDFYDTRTPTHMILSTFHPLLVPQRFFDTRGFGNPIPAGEYHPLPPYPHTDPGTGQPLLDDPPNAVQIRGCKVNVKIVPGMQAGFLIAYTTPGETPNTSIIDFTYGDAPAYNALIDIPITADGHFQVFINVPAHIVCDLYGYWT
jgi:hypothetical protein